MASEKSAAKSVKNRMADKDLLLVGSIGLDTAEEVFRWAADGGLTAQMPCMPDGEVGDRSFWVVMMGYRVFNGHPDLETIGRPDRVNGVENWKPKGFGDIWSFRVKPGVDTVRFGDPGWRLGYARDAINSYFVFKTLREKGVIPAGLRFQVCLPMTYSGFASQFHDPADWPKVAPGFEAALRAEVAKIVEQIPVDDLVIQWDAAVELGLLDDSMPWQPHNDQFEAMAATIAPLAAAVPEPVMLGYHLCYGNLSGWPMRRPDSLETAIQLSHAMLERSGRQVDFLHIPLLDHAPDSYFEPLGKLRPGDTRVYLGVIHNMGDVADFRRRLAMGRRYVGEFGIAGPCGYGRLGPSATPRLMQEHLRALEIFHE